MPASIRKLVLVPGMDGTGKLFAEFSKALADELEPTIASYPTDDFRSYGQLKELILASLPQTEPFALLAESFSTPLVIQCAAENPKNLKALILCTGFAQSPITGLVRILVRLLAPIAFGFRLRAAMIRKLLAGQDASDSLVHDVQEAVSEVHHNVLLGRLRAILACDARKELAQITVPILYLGAAGDKLVPARCMEEILRVKPDTSVVSIQGPHLLLQREPRKAAEAVANFLRQLE